MRFNMTPAPLRPRRQNVRVALTVEIPAGYRNIPARQKFLVRRLPHLISDYFPHVHYSTPPNALKPRDKLIAYSDGATGAESLRRVSRPRRSWPLTKSMGHSSYVTDWFARKLGESLADDMTFAVSSNSASSLLLDLDNDEGHVVVLPGAGGESVGRVHDPINDLFRRKT